MQMTPKTVVIGVLLVIAAIIFVAVYWPYATRIEAPSEIFRSLAPEELKGKAVYIENSCVLLPLPGDSPCRPGLRRPEDSPGGRLCGGQTHPPGIGTNRARSFPGRR